MKKANKNRILAAIYSLLFIFLSGCEKENVQKIEQRNWQLVWSDEFNGVAGVSPDAAKWKYDIGTGNNGWGNAELEYYTNRTSNVSLDGNGNLAALIHAADGTVRPMMNTRRLASRCA